MVVHSPSKPTTTPWPALLPMGALAGKPPVPIARPATLVGSRQTANLRLHSSTVSKAHALILSGDSKVHIRDLNSRTKVFVNGKEVREADLREGDQVKIGRFSFRFTAGPKIQSNARRRTLAPGQLETDDGDVVPLTRRVTVIGQRAGCDLVLPNPAVSTTHAAIYDVNGRRYILDLGSRTGTLVNNQKTLQVELKVGDVIDIGGTDVRYAGGDGAAAPATVARGTAKAPAAAAVQEENDIDELLALDSLNEAPAPPKPSGQSKIFEPPASVPDDTNAPIPLDDDGMKLPEPAEELEAEEEVGRPPAIDESKLFDPPSSVPDDTDAPIAVEEAEVEAEVESEAQVEPEPKPKVEAESAMSALGEEPETIPVEIDDETASPEPEAPIAVPQNRADDVDAAKSAEDELMALLDETLESESQRDARIASEQETLESAEESAPVAEEEPLAIEEESPMPIEEEAVAIEEKPPQVVAEPIEQVEREVELESEPEPEPSVAQDEGEVVGTATANVDVIPDQSEEIAEEVQEAATTFPDEQLPAIEEEQAPVAANEPVAPPPEIEESAEPIAIAEPEVIETEPAVDELEVSDDSKQDVAAEAPLAVSEPAIEELDAHLEEEPQAQVNIAPEPVSAPAPEPAAAAPAESEPEGEVATPPAAAGPEAKEIFEEPPKLAPGAPKPRWIAAPSTTQFTPTVINIQRPRPPVNFNLDELLEEKKSSPFAAGSAQQIKDAPAEAPAAPAQEPLEVAPPVIEETVSEPLAIEESAEAEMAPTVEERIATPAPSDEVVDEDDVALAALEELAPVEAKAQAEQESEPEAPTEPIEEVEEIAEEAPQEVVATTSAQIVPEAPATVSATLDLAPSEDDASDLLEELPEEEGVVSAPPRVQESDSPILSFAAAAPAAVEAEEEGSQSDEPSAPDVFSLGHRRAPAARTPAARGGSSPGRISPRPRASAPIPPRWGPLASAAAADIVPAATGRRTRKKLSVLLVLMLVAMVLALLAVWKFVLPRVLVQGTIRFENAGNLRGDARDSFQKTQLDLLADAKVRATAEGLFKAKPGRPAAAGFFVDQDFRHPQLKSIWQSNGDKAELQITYQGTDPTLDPDRLSCVLQAIYEANRSNVSTAAAAERTLDQKRMAVSAARAEVTKVRERRVTLESIVRPDAFELAATQAAVDKLDQAWTEALAARKAIAADIDRLQQPAEASGSGARSETDSALKLMSEKLAVLNGRLAEAKSSAAREASDARKSLNTTIEQFQASIGVAQGMMKDNPALASYISSAQKLHEASWKLQGDLIERQERQQKQLLEYKKRLEEQVEIRKREMIEKDPDLKELNHLLEMKRREFNALSATGALKRDVEKLRSDISTLEGRILARTVAVSEDKFYKDAIAGLKQIIDSVQGQLDTDRAASEKLMNDLETKFRNTSPEIETLPSAQRSLAARLAEQANAMQAARKHYSEAVVSQDADANDRLKDLQAEAAALEGEIALRRKELSAEQQKKLTDQQSEELKKKQAALADAEKAERAARDAYRQKIKELDMLVERDRAYQTTREELQRLIQVDEPLKVDQQNAAERAVAVAQRGAESAIAPQQPMPPKIMEMQDNRFLFGTGAVVVVGLIFGSLIFFTTHADPRHRQSATEGKPISA